MAINPSQRYGAALAEQAKFAADRSNASSQNPTGEGGAFRNAVTKANAGISFSRGFRQSSALIESRQEHLARKRLLDLAKGYDLDTKA